MSVQHFILRQIVYIIDIYNRYMEKRQYIVLMSVDKIAIISIITFGMNTPMALCHTHILATSLIYQ